MATKAQERAALEKIRKIVDGLGEESYIGHAMDGVFEDAEQNIENDFWNSYRDRYEYRDAECGRLEKEVDKANERADGLESKLKSSEAKAQVASEEANKWFNLYNTLKTNADAAKLEAHNRAAELQRKVEEQELEIIKLKAKLYDMMVGA